MMLRSVLRSLAVLSVVAGVAAPGPALAQKRSGLPVSVIIVDVPQIQRESLAGRSLVSQRDKYQQGFQADFNATRQKLQTADQELAKQRGTIPQDVYDQKAKSLEQEVVGFQRHTQATVRALEKSTEAAGSELMNAILTITGEIAAEMGANLVIPKQQVLLHEPSMDITAQVIERLNRKMSAVTFPAPTVDESETTAKPSKK